MVCVLCSIDIVEISMANENLTIIDLGQLFQSVLEMGFLDK